MQGISRGELIAARKAHEAAAKKHAAEARANAEFFGPSAVHWHEEARVRTSYVTELQRTRRDHGRSRIRPRGAGRPRTRRTTCTARANAPPGDGEPSDDEPGEHRAGRWLDRYLVALLESSARADGLPLAIFAEGIAHHCGPGERRELDRLLALAAPVGVAA
jgi:hypothetical protein